MTHFTQDWTKSRAATWRQWLGVFAGKDPIHGLEVGTFEGRSACWFLDHVLTGLNSIITCIDDWSAPWFDGPSTEARFDANTAGRAVRKIKAVSRVALSQLAIENARFHFVYVDGDHSAAECLADLCQAWPLIVPGGVLIADDYTFTSPNRPIPPKPAIDAFLHCYADRIAGYEIVSRMVAIWKPTVAGKEPEVGLRTS